MKFNKGNYELYVIDYLERKLSEEDYILFIKFLKDHPEINEEIENFQALQLQSGDEHFPDKHILKKSGSTSQYQDDFNNYCTAYLEGDLGSAEKTNFENWISNHPEKANELELFRKVYLRADMNIIFSPKSGLKKRYIVQNQIRLISILSTAAAVIIFLIIFFRPADNTDRNIISEDNNTNLEVISEKEVLTEEILQINIENEQFQNHQSAEKLLTKEELNNTGMEKILIEPVSSILAQLENHQSVRFDKLKQQDQGEERNFDDYKTLREFVNENILSGFFSLDGRDEPEKTTVWTLASNGLDGLNNITDGGYAIDRETNENGALKRVSLETPLLGISFPVKNKQSQ